MFTNPTRFFQPIPTNSINSSTQSPTSISFFFQRNPNILISNRPTQPGNCTEHSVSTEG